MNARGFGTEILERRALLVLSPPMLWNHVFDGLQSNLSTTRFDGDKRDAPRLPARLAT
jgi:hypothetical protein